MEGSAIIMELQANDIVIIIGAVAAAIVTIMMAFAKMKRELMGKMDENIAKTVESIDKTVENLDKTDSIEKSVNGHSTRLADKLESMGKEISGLEAIIQEQRRTAAALAIKEEKE